jgi:Ca2+-binding RTX toxin-like protein
MGIQYNSVADFNVALRSLLQTAEGLIPQPRNVGDDTITYGYSYTFLRRDQNNVWSVYRPLEQDLNLIGITLTDAELRELGRIRDDLNASRIDSARTRIAAFTANWGRPDLTDPNANTLFNTDVNRIRLGIRDQFRRHLRSNAAGDALYNTIFGSGSFREAVALVSLAYNAPALIGPKLTKALSAGERGTAWFEIRYGSNKDSLTAPNDFSNGWAKRRFAEAQVFGLYDNPGSVTADEAKSVYRMLQTNRKQIFDYERIYGVSVDGQDGSRGNWIEQAIADFGGAASIMEQGTVNTLQEAFEPAKRALLGDLRNLNPELATYLQDGAFEAASIYLNPNKPNAQGSVAGATLDAGAFETFYGSRGNSSNDLLVGADQRDKLVAGRGSDVLIGGAGNDWLEGGPGADVLIGGTGQDAYAFNPGESPAEDKIIDEDRRGFFIFKDASGRATPVSGVYVQDPSDPTRWYEPGTPQVVITHQSPWTITLPDGSTINLGEDFEEGNFGIQLLDAPTDPQPTGDPIVGDLTPVEPEQYDALGNLVTDPNQPAPDRADVLNGSDISTESDLIQSKGGDDVVAAKAGDDKIEAGTGSDIVNAGEGNDLVLGGADLDLLWGMAGNDRLYADAEVDLTTAIAQGETDLPTGTKGELMDGGEGEDILVGGPGNDALVGGGGTGANVILGGAGDDLLLGHVRITTAAREWTVTRTVQQGAGGTQYLWGFNNATAEQDSTPSDDALYGGQGNDWLFGGQGNDVLDGGSGEDVLFGAVGADVLVGGGDKDVLVGEQGDDFLTGDAGDGTLEGDAGSDFLEGGGGDDPLRGRGTKLSCRTRNCNSRRAHKQVARFSMQSWASRRPCRKSVLTLRGGAPVECTPHRYPRRCPDHTTPPPPDVRNRSSAPSGGGHVAPGILSCGFRSVLPSRLAARVAR